MLKVIKEKIEADSVIDDIFNQMFKDNCLLLPMKKFNTTLGAQLAEQITFEAYLVRLEEYNLAAENKKLIDNIKSVYVHYMSKKNYADEDIAENWSLILARTRQEAYSYTMEKLEELIKNFMK